MPPLVRQLSVLTHAIFYVFLGGSVAWWSVLGTLEEMTTVFCPTWICYLKSDLCTPNRHKHLFIMEGNGRGRRPLDSALDTALSGHDKLRLDALKATRLWNPCYLFILITVWSDIQFKMHNNVCDTLCSRNLVSWFIPQSTYFLKVRRMEKNADHSSVSPST